MKIVVIGALLILVGCVKDTYFGPSTYGEVITLEVSQQSGATSIEGDTIRVTVSPELDPAQTIITEYSISNFATSSLAKGDTVDAVTPYAFTVTAEDGSVHTYYLAVDRSLGEEQIADADFEEWHEVMGGLTGKTPYLEPGVDKRVWATANAALATFKVSDTNTTRYTTADGSYAIKMKTIKAPALVRIAAATAFTGVFYKDIALGDPQHPQNAVDFGIPFSSRPVSISFRYYYSPGDDNQDADGQSLDYSDAGDVYFLLEVRSGEDENRVIERLGTAWLRQNSAMGNWKDTTLEIIYGELPTDAPNWQKPTSGLYASPSALPTHASLVMSSSAMGDFFEGAIGSELIVDNVVLNY